jgi:hypothetical protein
MPSKESRQPFKADSEKAQVLEYKQHRTSGKNAQPQQLSPSPPLDSLDPHARKVVNENSDEQYQYIHRYKRHVEEATGGQQPAHSLPLWQEKVDGDYNREEDCEFERVE